jgi:SNF family Na+-dependent transporter
VYFLSDVGLAFIVYPEVVTKLPAPPFWSFLFFLMLFLLGLDTQFVTVETLTVAIVEEFPQFFKKRVYVSLVLCVGMYFLGLPLVTEVNIILTQ